jgi:hypothetical protein
VIRRAARGRCFAAGYRHFLLRDCMPWTLFPH